MNERSPAAIVGLLRRFCAADPRRRFSFASGVAGAAPRLDAELAVEFLRFLLASLLPIRAAGLILRTLLRRLRATHDSPLASRTVVSLGGGAGAADTYFGPYLASEKAAYNYLKVVGGSAVRASGFAFVESALTAGAMLRLLAWAAFQPAIVVAYVVDGMRRIEDARERRLFAALALAEASAGGLLQNRILAEALGCHLAGGAVRTLLYPMEGRTWEKKLVTQARAAGVRACGYLHCALTPRHAGLLHEGFFAPGEIPDVMSAPGPVPAGRLAARFPGVEVRARHFVRGERQAPAKRDPSLLLFALTGNVDESARILQAAASLAATKAHRVVVRLNPTTSTYGQLCALARGLGLAIYEDGEPVLPGFCFYRSSSAAIDYLRLGVVPAYLALDGEVGNDSFELNPHPAVASLRVDADFAAAAAALIARHGAAGVTDGRAVANRYLDTDYDPARMKGLGDLT